MPSPSIFLGNINYFPDVCLIVGNILEDCGPASVGSILYSNLPWFVSKLHEKV